MSEVFSQVLAGCAGMAMLSLMAIAVDPAAARIANPNILPENPKVAVPKGEPTARTNLKKVDGIEAKDYCVDIYGRRYSRDGGTRQYKCVLDPELNKLVWEKR